MSESAADTLRKVKGIVLEEMAQYEVDIYLFGSYARGDSHRTSDIDIAVDPRGVLPPDALSRLRDALEESSIARRVEVVDLREADAEFRERVREEGIRWSAFENA